MRRKAAIEEVQIDSKVKQMMGSVTTKAVGSKQAVIAMQKETAIDQI